MRSGAAASGVTLDACGAAGEGPGDEAAGGADVGLDVLSLLATRMCHDFAGALGTLAGTLDLAAEGGGEAAQLSQEIAAVLVARVRLLRAAWGGGAGPLDAEGVRALLAGLPGIERFRLDFSGLTVPLAPSPARLVLCAVLVAATLLPRGGSIAVAAEGDAATLKLHGAVWPDAVAGAADWRNAGGPRGLPLPLACLTARGLGWMLLPAGETLRIVPNAGGPA